MPKSSITSMIFFFGYESTGPYAEHLVHFMRARGVHMVQVSPMHTKRLKELQGNSPNKTDQKDPKVIADIMALGHALTVVIPPTAEPRRLTQMLFIVIEARRQSLQVFNRGQGSKSFFIIGFATLFQFLPELIKDLQLFDVPFVFARND